MSDIIFIPFGEFAPDRRYLGNEESGMLMAREVVPVYGSYITSPDTPSLATITGAGFERGLHVHFQTGDGYAAVDVGANGRLFQITEPLGLPSVVTDRSRAALYTFGTEWYGCSFGANVIMANGVDAVQFRDGGGASLFADMITSTFAPVGQFPFAFKNNLFLANLTLPAAYDTLPIGANPTVVAWSRNDDIRQFGSSNVDPQIIGADYQPLNFDIGNITGAIGGTDYAIIACSNGFVRLEGPPYTFTVVADGSGCLYPYSMVRVREDVYFWGPSGLMRLPGGFGPVESVGLGKFTRSLIDNVTGFSDMSWIDGGQIISGAYDAVNDIVVMAYRSSLVTTTGVADPHTQTFLWHNVVENRSSVATMPRYDTNDLVAPIHYLRTGKQTGVGSAWSPARDIRFLTNSADAAPDDVTYRKFGLGGIPQPLVLHSGFKRFYKDRVSRVIRIRPVYTLTDPAAVAGTWSATFESVNRHSAAPTVKGPYTTLDAHGWIVTPDTVFADLHAIRLSVATTSDVYKIAEYRGFEVEVVSSGAYAA